MKALENAVDNICSRQAAWKFKSKCSATNGHYLIRRKHGDRLLFERSKATNESATW